MTEIRCPMCGKENPAGEKTCRYCQARLTPVGTSPSVENTPNWLQELTAESGQTQEPEPLSAEQEPEWLVKLRQTVPADESVLVSKEEMQNEIQANNDVPDWIRNLNPEGPVQPEPTVPEPEKTSVTPVDDWLDRLDTFQSPMEAEQPLKEADEWLKEPSPESQATIPASKVDLSQWLSSLPPLEKEQNTLIRPA